MTSQVMDGGMPSYVRGFFNDLLSHRVCVASEPEFASSFSFCKTLIASRTSVFNVHAYLLIEFRRPNTLSHFVQDVHGHFRVHGTDALHLSHFSSGSLSVPIEPTTVK